MLFVGTYEHAIDAKQRLAIPSEIRGQMEASGEGDSLYAVLLEGPTLGLYTARGFEKRAEQLDDSPRDAEDVLAYEQLFYALAQRLEVDKQGRVRLPERLMELANLGRDVVIIGVKDHLEIHNREAWNQKMKNLLSGRPDLLMNPRRVMRAKNGENNEK